MKKAFAFLLIAVTGLQLNVLSQNNNDAEQEIKTLIKKVDDHGFYISMDMRYAMVKPTGVKNDAFHIGGRLAWIANHYLAIGMAGHGIIGSSFHNDVLMKKSMLTGGYGGFIVEPIIFPKEIIHISVPILIGGGGAILTDSQHHHTQDPDNYIMDDQDNFFILEPGVEAELNVFKHFRFAAGVHYRFTNGIDLLGVKKNALDGFSAGVSLKFGIF
ncbi:MAG: hypothetical protein A2275_06420 [Bacteroidetes bacterium RIFOXYA12_FULL_35_11]|nr:MAG: hypothetical protein A2X01_12120 [Bacteroidetes bacterium GWF2_35_48]OFY82994.1 MAG: hypothetical protein A2275_06420 [Bacteroidetes bacterium RIFOXYA12_FULL_35_11]OFY96548.1 MAG: hypothetical protein A2309_14465 [Bacteroidetes bacterium RIFOXYB2_FULL_35_7]OFZ05116.1 MAG: hypothetical protein A2491_07400 [Bacteroidetes bacterium RIFOXYC12_FULL_35_7]HBX49488.1 hypothetical protein [Bacteroidales bacterium]